MSYLHEWHMQRHNFLNLRPLGSWRGAKRSHNIKSQLLSQFQGFLNQTLFVYSQMKDIKHITRNFHSSACVMPKVLGLGGAGGLKIKFSEHGHEAYKIQGMNISPGTLKNFTLQSNW